MSGIISVVTTAENGDGQRQLLAVGDVDYQLWSRSLLKPWQLLSNLVVLKKAYPSLQLRHFALMMASHSGESEHLCVLQEMLEIGKLREEMLKCPNSMPLSEEARLRFRQAGGSPRPLFHNCSGKHLGYLLALKASKGRLEAYLEPDGAHFVLLRNTLAALLYRSPSSFQATTDGCQLPNYALSACEMAGLYQSLQASKIAPGQGVSGDIEAILDGYGYLQKIAKAYPQLHSGTGRVDMQIKMAKLNNLNLPVGMVAKEGADGLLAIGIAPCQRYRHGVGILIKSASGFVNRHMELLVGELLRQIGLVEDHAEAYGDAQPHLKTKFHFHFQC